MTRAGEYRLWTARNTGHVSAASLLQILAVPGSKPLVFRCERKGGAARCLRARSACELFWRQVRSEVDRSWSITCICTDAFSSDIARRDALKVQVTDVILCSSSRPRMRFVPDVLRVSYGTSQELRSLILTQLRNMGTKTWLEGSQRITLRRSCFGR